MPRPKSPLEPRRWFDNSLPQTLQIALLLLYIDGFFLLLHFLDRTDAIGTLRSTSAVGLAGSLVFIGSHVGGGYLLANGRRLGHHLAMIAAFSPFVIRLWTYVEIGARLSLYGVVTGRDLVSFMFEAALVALVLHPQSLRHARVWLA